MRSRSDNGGARKTPASDAIAPHSRRQCQPAVRQKPENTRGGSPKVGYFKIKNFSRQVFFTKFACYIFSCKKNKKLIVLYKAVSIIMGKKMRVR